MADTLLRESRRPGLELGVLRERKMRELIEAIAKAVVDRPEAVTVEETQGVHTRLLVLTVAREDRGQVIGKGGSHADAIRTLLKAASGKDDYRYFLEIVAD